MKIYKIDYSVAQEIYDPVDWKKSLGYELNKKCCAKHIFTAERSDIGGHQCSRTPKVMLNGYGFCTYHAKKILGYAGRNDIIDDL